MKITLEFEFYTKTVSIHRQDYRALREARFFLLQHVISIIFSNILNVNKILHQKMLLFLLNSILPRFAPQKKIDRKNKNEQVYEKS